jgi:ATP-binding cassette subfamily F protein uup
MDPSCYEKKGIVKTSQELEEIQKIYDQKVEKYLSLEEIVESFK